MITAEEDFTKISAEVALCASSWDIEARLIGNVKAGDIARFCARFDVMAAIIASQAAEIKRLREAAEKAQAKLKTQFKFVCDFDSRIATPDYAKYQVIYQAANILEQALNNQATGDLWQKM